MIGVTDTFSRDTISRLRCSCALWSHLTRLCHLFRGRHARQESVSAVSESGVRDTCWSLRTWFLRRERAPLQASCV